MSSFIRFELAQALYILAAKMLLRDVFFRQLLAFVSESLGAAQILSEAFSLKTAACCGSRLNKEWRVLTARS